MSKIGKIFTIFWQQKKICFWPFATFIVFADLYCIYWYLAIATFNNFTMEKSGLNGFAKINAKKPCYYGKFTISPLMKLGKNHKTTILNNFLCPTASASARLEPSTIVGPRKCSTTVLTLSKTFYWWQSENINYIYNECYNIMIRWCRDIFATDIF